MAKAKWEYALDQHDWYRVYADDIESSMAERSAEGWELVSYTAIAEDGGDTRWVHIVWRREVSEADATAKHAPEVTR